MDADIEHARAEAESTRQASELARQESERGRIAAEAERVDAEDGRRLAATEMAHAVATLAELLGRMEAVEQLRRDARHGPPE